MTDHAKEVQKIYDHIKELEIKVGGVYQIINEKLKSLITTKQEIEETRQNFLNENLPTFP